MNDKIYRRVTQPSGNPKTTMKKNVKNRKRSMIMNFRVTPEEKELIEARIRLSGLSKETFFIESCLYQAIFVKGNVKTFDAIWKSMKAIESMDELKDILELMKREEALLDLLDEDDRLMSQQQKENETLRIQNHSLKETLKKQKKRISSLIAQIDRLTDQNNAYMKQNSILQEQNQRLIQLINE